MNTSRISSTSLKRKLLEVGYILKQELETVDAWDKRVANEHNVKTQNIDISKLLADNTQLYNENKKLQEVILKLKGVIDEKIPQIEKAFSHVHRNNSRRRTTTCRLKNESISEQAGTASV